MLSVPRVALLEFRFYWAPLPGLVPTPRVARVALRARDAEALVALGDALAALPQRPATAVYGRVTRLDLGDTADAGLATIQGVVGRETPRTVRLAVRGNQYEDAIRAYRTRVPVVATGRLRRAAGGVHVLTGTLAVP
jgi:hypothetical protein